MSILTLEPVELVNRDSPVIILFESKGIIVGVESVAHGGAAYSQDLSGLSETDVPGMAVTDELAYHVGQLVNLLLQTL